MNCEENRLRTFVSWPTDAAVDPGRIAKAGFFSTGRDLEVQCFKCNEKISEWSFGDQVMARHRRLNPDCPFVSNPVESDNVPILANASVPSSQTLQYRGESARLRTFSRWPVPNIVSPERLAKSGFYYLQHGDKVKCAFCSGVVGHWEMGDDPDNEHRRHFPLCPMHCNVSTTHRPNIDELGIQAHRGPKTPKFATLESRLVTFANWPSECRQTPQQLAQAGFYYIGQSDQVRCFHCDLGLRFWDPADCPWREHARWFSTCGYVLLVKGDEFVKAVLAAHPPNEEKERELEAALATSTAQAALTTGLDLPRVRRALKDKLERTGRLFDSADELVEAALRVDVSAPFEVPTPGLPGGRSQSWSGAESSVDSVVPPVSPAPLADGALVEENRRLKEARLCKICMDDEVGVVFLPCGHLVTCVVCAPSLADCPMCRQPIKATVRTFLS